MMMRRLRDALSDKYSEKITGGHKMKIYSPKNCEQIDILFHGEKIAKVLINFT